MKGFTDLSEVLMGENFWTVERLLELRRPLEAKAEAVDGADHQLIKIEVGLSKYV